MLLEVTKSLDETFVTTNTICVSPIDFPNASSELKPVCRITPCLNGSLSSFEKKFLFTILSSTKMSAGSLGFSGHQRKYCNLGIGQQVDLSLLSNTEMTKLMNDTCSLANIELSFLKKAEADKYSEKSLNSDQMAIEFSQQFNSQVFEKNQPFIFVFDKLKFNAKILKLESISLKSASSNRRVKLSEMTQSEVEASIITANTKICFQASDTSPLMLSGKSQDYKSKQNSIINPEFDFAQMGIGGLGDEFKEIFRRAFASRIFPPEIVQKMGGKHVKGILLHGPPGCGKTLMARKIGKMLSAREPQVVNGPEILNKYVGESEANVRKLFEPAEEEQKKLGKKSGLHIIIFDEIDAICKHRGASASSGSQVGDTVVNQLLSKIDGVDQLDNILIIGMTNRPDLIDEALLRPGRLEVKKEISLPNEPGRLEIFKIHTEKMTSNDMLSSDVDLKELAMVTKNFSGAEIEGLARAAQSYAFTRHTKAGTKVEVNWETIENIQVNRADFQNALDKDIKPAFGLQEDQFEPFLSSGILNWGKQVSVIVEDVKLLIDQVKISKRKPFVTCLLEGVTGAGKTALAAYLAKKADFPFVKFCAPKDFIGYSENAKSNKIAKIFEDAHKSMLSIIMIDDIERLVEYNPIGPRFSNVICQTLLVLLKKNPPLGKRLLIIATSSRKSVLEQMGMTDVFDSIIRCPVITNIQDLISALTLMEAFDKKSRNLIFNNLESHSSCFVPIKKLIHIVGAIEQMDKDDIVARFLTVMETDCGLTVD